MNKKASLRNTLHKAVVAGIFGMIAASSAVSAQTSQWVDTLTPAHDVSTATFERSVSDSEPLFIAVTLKPQNEDLLNSYLDQLFRPGSLLYQQFLSKSDSRAFFSPTQAQAQAVADYLTQQGFTNVTISDSRLVVSANGNAGMARRAFHTDLARYSRNGNEGIANLYAAQVPAQLSGVVSRVLGLQTLDRMQTMNLHSAKARSQGLSAWQGTSTPAAAAASTTNTASYYGDEFATIYKAGTVSKGTSTDVAIIGWGDMTDTIADLKQFESDRKITAVTTNVVALPKGTSSTDDSGEDEWAMDAQAIVGISGGVKGLTFYAAEDSTNANLELAIDQAVTDDTAKVINMSWGMPESQAEVTASEVTTGGITTAPGVFDDEFKIGVTQGQTFSASSGDCGAYVGCASNGSSYSSTEEVGYPASSSFVIAVGGTNVTTNTTNDAYVSETAWAYSGGGVSQFIAQPSWQSKKVPYKTYRNVPDIAFDSGYVSNGSPEDGIKMYITQEAVNFGGFTFYEPVNGYIDNGGTSLASPLFVGAWARLESANNNKLGFAPPAIYAYAVGSNGAEASWLHDVTAGSNGPGGTQPGYAAGKGYDNVTGWGSFNIQALNTFITNTPGFVTKSNSETTPN